MSKHTIMLFFTLLGRGVCFIFLSHALLRADTQLQDFNELPVTTDLTDATAMVFSPEGRLFVCEKRGTLRLIKSEVLLADPVLTLNVATLGEQGLIGVALDPGFPSLPFVYVHYTVPSFPAHNRVSRFTLDGDRALPDSEQVLLDLSPLGDIAGHDGGALRFGADGKLYIGTGDAETPRNSQSLATLHGKLLRINPDGSIPQDNPFVPQLTGSLQAIWALGLRNPYTFAIQPGTGRIFINDVGENSWEEIDEGVAGSNYGWPETEGYTDDPRFQNPIFAYPHPNISCIPDKPCTGLTGDAIVGGTFYNPIQPQYPPEYLGSYFFADYVFGWIERLDPTSGMVSHFASNLQAPVDLQVSPDGTLYYLSRGQDQIGLDNGVSYLVASAQSGVFKFVYTPNRAPVYTQQPMDRSVAIGQPATFRIAGFGSTPLSFEWQRNGVTIPGANTYIYTVSAATKADDGAQFRCVMKNAIGSTLSAPATLGVIDATPPVGTILTPDASYRYRAGDVITFSGSATDAKDGSLPPSAFSWQVVFYHNTNTHPFLSAINNLTQGSFTIPVGYLPFAVPNAGETADVVWYRLYMTVTNSSGLTQTTFRDIHPQAITLRLETVPYGLGLSSEDQPRVSPFTAGGVAGMNRSIGAYSPQLLDDTPYEFVSWSDGGDRVHDLMTPPQDATYRAIFRTPQSNSAVPVSDYFRSQSLDTSLWSFVNPLGDGAVQITSSGAALTLPGGTSHDIWTDGNNSARILQEVPNVDFSAEAKFNSAVTTGYQDEGILIEQDATNFLRLHLFHDGTNVIVSAINFTNGTPVTLLSQEVPNAKAPYVVRVKRVGDTWKINWFVGDVNADRSATTILPLTVTRIGPYASNNALAPGGAPDFTAVVGYFVNTLNPVEQQSAMTPDLIGSMPHIAAEENWVTSFTQKKGLKFWLW